MWERLLVLFFHILYSHFKFFFQQYLQCFLTQKHGTLSDNVTILEVYVVATSLNYFNLKIHWYSARIGNSKKIIFQDTANKHQVCQQIGQEHKLGWWYQPVRTVRYQKRSKFSMSRKLLLLTMVEKLLRDWNNVSVTCSSYFNFVLKKSCFVCHLWIWSALGAEFIDPESKSTFAADKIFKYFLDLVLQNKSGVIIDDYHISTELTLNHHVAWIAVHCIVTYQYCFCIGSCIHQITIGDVHRVIASDSIL